MELHEFSEAELKSSNHSLKTKIVENMIFFKTKWIAEITQDELVTEGTCSSGVFAVGPNDSVTFSLELKIERLNQQEGSSGSTAASGNLGLELRLLFVGTEVVKEVSWEASRLNYKLHTHPFTNRDGVAKYEWDKRSSREYLFDNKYIVVIVEAFIQISPKYIDSASIPPDEHFKIPKLSNSELRSLKKNITRWCYLSGLNLSCKYHLSLRESRKSRSVVSPEFINIESSPCPEIAVQFELYTENVPTPAGLRRDIPQDVKIIFSEHFHDVVLFWSMAILGRGGEFRFFPSSSKCDSIDLCLSSSKKKKFDDWQNYFFDKESMVFVAHILVGFPVRMPEVVTKTDYMRPMTPSSNWSSAQNEHQPGTTLGTAHESGKQDLDGSFIVSSFTDFDFLVEGKKLAVHRDILRIKSQFFKDLFERQPKLKELQLIDLSFDQATKLIEYFYKGSLKDVDHRLAMALIPQAQAFKLGRLFNLCEKVILKNITLHNVLDILKHAKKHSFTKLKQESLYFAAFNLNKVAKEKCYAEFLTKEPELSIDLLLTIRELPNNNHFEAIKID